MLTVGTQNCPFFYLLKPFLKSHKHISLAAAAHSILQCLLDLPVPEAINRVQHGNEHCIEDQGHLVHVQGKGRAGLQVHEIRVSEYGHHQHVGAAGGVGFLPSLS